jgi:hypothetical protein
MFCLATFVTVIQMAIECPPGSIYGGVHAPKLTELVLQSGVPLSSDSIKSAFKVPMVPNLPCSAAFVNWYLVAQLGFAGLAMLVGYLGVVSLCIWCYIKGRSCLGSSNATTGTV